MEPISRKWFTAKQKTELWGRWRHPLYLRLFSA